MIYITLGSQKFQFNRLLQEVDTLIENNLITDSVFAQIGYSTYRPKFYEYKDFLNRDDFLNKMNKCELIITHGGTGAIVSALKQNKKVIAIPRLSKYCEHIDDHQIQIITEFKTQNLICGLNDCSEIIEGINFVSHHKFSKFHSSTNEIIASIENFIENN